MNKSQEVLNKPKEGGNNNAHFKLQRFDLNEHMEFQIEFLRDKQNVEIQSGNSEEADKQRPDIESDHQIHRRHRSQQVQISVNQNNLDNDEGHSSESLDGRDSKNQVEASNEANNQNEVMLSLNNEKPQINKEILLGKHNERGTIFKPDGQSSLTMKDQLRLYNILQKINKSKKMRLQENVMKFSTKFRKYSRFYDPNILSEYHYEIINDKTNSQRGQMSQVEHCLKFKHIQLHQPRSSFSKYVKLYIYNSSKKLLRIKESLASVQLDCTNLLDKLGEAWHIYNIPLVNSNSLPIIVFELVHIICIFYTFITISLYYIFANMEFFTSHLFFNLYYTVLGVYSVDIILSLNSKILIMGDLIEDRSQIMVQYLKDPGGFFVDLLTLVGFVAFQEINQNYLSLLFLFKHAKLKKLIGKIENFCSLNGQLKSYWELTKLLGSILFIAHFLNCLWIFVGNYSQARYQTSWIQEKQTQNDDYQLVYLYGMHFILMTMTTIGYGDIVPNSPPEHLITLFIMVQYNSLTLPSQQLLSTGIFGYSLNRINQILSDLDQAEENFKEQKFQILNYMQQRNIKAELQRRILNYFECGWRSSMFDQIEKQKHVLSKLSSPLYDELQYQDKGYVLNEIPLIKKSFSEQLIRQISLIMKEHRYYPKDIISENMTNDDHLQAGLLHIYSGSVKYICQNVMVEEFEAKSNLSLNRLFTTDQAKYKLQANTFTIIYSLSREDFLQTLRQPAFAKDYESYCQIRDQLQQIPEKKIQNSRCYSCSEQDHQTFQCPLISYRPNREMIKSKFSHKFEQKRAKEYIRKQNIKINSRKKQKEIQQSMFKYHAQYSHQYSYNNQIISIDSKDQIQQIDKPRGINSQEEQFLATIIESDEQYNYPNIVIREINYSIQGYLKEKISGQQEEQFEQTQKNPSQQSIILQKQLSAKRISLPNLHCIQNTEKTNLNVTNNPLQSNVETATAFRNSQLNLVNFDISHNFSNYFPEFNIETIILSLNKKAEAVRGYLQFVKNKNLRKGSNKVQIQKRNFRISFLDPS